MTKTAHKESQLFTLSVKQLNAVDLVAIGLNDKEAAEKVGVERETVTRWRLYHPAFQAELNKKRKEIWGASMDKMRALVPKALDAIESTLSDLQNPNRWKVAVKLLEIAGIPEAELSTIGEDDPNKIVKTLARASFDETLDLVSEYEISRIMSGLTERLDTSLGDPPNDSSGGKEKENG